MIGPKMRWPVSQLRSRGELRAKANAASSTKGVVGSIGRITPTAPSASDIAPTLIQRARSTSPTLGGWSGVSVVRDGSVLIALPQADVCLLNRISPDSHTLNSPKLRALYIAARRSCFFLVEIPKPAGK